MTMTVGQQAQSSPSDWPELLLSDWADTCTTLHLWTQIVGKIRLAHAPMVNHWWQAPLYVTCRGLTKSPIPYEGKSFQIYFDFFDQTLNLQTIRGEVETVVLGPRSVADFYTEVMSRLRGLGLETRIWTMPVEIPDAIPFEQDGTHASYDPEYVTRFWQILVQVDRIFARFRGQFVGKVSPVHFFLGSFDIAVTPFSGRAPPLLGNSPNVGAWVMQEAYWHAVSSCGFWPGNGGFGKPAFYSYAYPEPQGFASARMFPDATYYDQTLKQHILLYDAVRQSTSPDDDLMRYLLGTYEAAAHLGQWDRSVLERAECRA